MIDPKEVKSIIMVTLQGIRQADRQARNIESKVDISPVDCLHAHKPVPDKETE